jgi:hypothetical protein
MEIRKSYFIRLLVSAAFAWPLVAHAQQPVQDAMPERVTFPSADAKTTLVGYVFKSSRALAARVPAVVMMHGRAGAY